MHPQLRPLCSLDEGQSSKTAVSLILELFQLSISLHICSTCAIRLRCYTYVGSPALAADGEIDFSIADRPLQVLFTASVFAILVGNCTLKHGEYTL